MASSNFFNAELKVRAISAIILAILVLSATWLGGRTFEILWMVAGLLVLTEFTNMTKAHISMPIRIAAFIMLIIIFGVWFSGNLRTVYFMAAVSISTLATWEALTRRSFWTPLAFAYAILPFIAMSELRGDAMDGFLLIILLFACVWGADIFAYIFGRLIGGPKLAPQISPKKTWAGFLGSLFGALLLCALVVTYSEITTSERFWFLIVIIAFVSQIGDLAISVIKRKFDIKDTGKIIPGHGGILDRIDGLIPSSVIMWVMLKNHVI